MVAFADLDAIALAVASWRGMAVRVVPLDEHGAPQAYAPLLELLDEAVVAPVADPSEPEPRPVLGRQPSHHPALRPSFATRAAWAYAPHGGKRDGMEGVSQWRNLSPRRDS